MSEESTNQIELVISQIKKKCPMFENRVTGVAELADIGNLDKLPNLKVPCVYVIPGPYSYDSNESMNGIWQLATASFDVVVALDNKTSRSGYDPARSVEGVRRVLHKALLGWIATPNQQRAMYADQDYTVFYDMSKLWRVFRYQADILFTDDDAYEPDGDPLKEINIKDTIQGVQARMIFD